MSVPHLNRRLVLEAPLRMADGAGGFRTSWTVLGEVWAEVRARGGREAASLGVPVSRTSLVVTVRAAPYGAPDRPVADQRFRDGARVFSIRSVTERDPQGQYLTCLVQEETAI